MSAIASGGPTYVDHPAPSVGFMLLLFFVLVVLIVGGLPAAVEEVSRTSSYLAPLVVGGCLAVLGFYFWPLYATYYELSPAGLLVRYGPWRRRYSYDEFETAFWQKGVFSTRIGWPSVTPCVRLTNAILLKRRSSMFGLFLTPNDPQLFLRKMSEFAPDLTREAIF